MTALIPTNHATGATPVVALPATPTARRRPAGGSIWDGPPHGAAQLGAAIVAVACGLFAVNLALLGFAWAALPVAVLTVGILVGTFLPDVLAARWEAGQEDTEAGA